MLADALGRRTHREELKIPLPAARCLLLGLKAQRIGHPVCTSKHLAFFCLLAPLPQCLPGARDDCTRVERPLPRTIVHIPALRNHAWSKVRTHRSPTSACHIRDWQGAARDSPSPLTQDQNGPRETRSVLSAKLRPRLLE